MPIHDWTRVSFGTFHNFHQGWMIALRDALNAGRLPEGYFAMAEQVVGRPEADVVALESDSDNDSVGSTLSRLRAHALKQFEISLDHLP